MNKMNRFFTLDEINPNLKLLEERFDEIHEEFMANKNNLFAITWGAEVGYYVQNAAERVGKQSSSVYKGWQVAPLYGTMNDILSINSDMNHYKHLIQVDDDLLKVKHNVSMLPILTKTLLEAGVRKRVGITILEAKKEIAWHSDPDPEKPGLAIIRGLWGLDVPEEEGKESFIYLNNNTQKVKFKNNEYVLFWGRTNHRVKNNLSSSRYMICFDHEVPYKKLLNT
jgi:hypothetical protein